MPAGTDDVVAITHRLVAASSQNPGQDERAVAAVVEDLCLELRLPRPRTVGQDGRPNLLVDLTFGEGGRRLALCGHLDTKPVGDAEWATDPLTATQVGQELRGLGVVDMKGAVAAMLLAAADAAADPPERGGLALVFCADEENGATFGARWLARHHPPQVDAMVIGEPTGLLADWDRLHLGSRGICNFDVEISTRQGHSGLRDVFDFVSATEVAARLVVDMGERFRPPHPNGTWKPTLNPGVVLRGGINYGVVPGRAHVASDCRLVPGMDPAEFEKEVRRFLDDRLHPDARADLTIRSWIPAAVVDESDPVIDVARDALTATLGTVPVPDVYPATTDATWFSEIGLPTLPALGPGLLRSAHGSDETVSLLALDQARTLYREMVRRYCERAA